MTNSKKLTEKESIAINIMKAIAILSVIAAHVVPASNINLFSKIVSSFWRLFGEVGVITFFVIGGFFYNRNPDDRKYFWSKKFYRIIIPWFFCATATYAISVILSHNYSVSGYIKWIFGSGTWYYYITIYTLFLFIFKWFYNKNFILYFLIILQTISLTLSTFGFSTTVPLSFMTDYLNPLNWAGYFSMGILIKRHLTNPLVFNKKFIIGVYSVAALSFYYLYSQNTFTYFNIISSLFCLSSLIIIADFSYKVSDTTYAKLISKTGTYSYCIYLLHLQIVQVTVLNLPDSMFKLIFSPFIGLAIMLVLISVGLSICNKLPFGEKVKSIVGL